VVGRMLKLALENDFSNVDQVGLVLSRMPSNPQQFHVGILYSSGLGPKVLHLWGGVVSQAPDARYCWFDLGLRFKKMDKVALLANILDIVENCGDLDLRYGFDDPKCVFDGAGNFKAEFAGHGFTCATFVLSVLESFGFPLLKCEEWPEGVEGNIDWQLDVVRHFISGDPEWARNLMHKVGAKRFTPCHAVAASQINIPCGFEHASALGAIIHDLVPFPKGLAA